MATIYVDTAGSDTSPYDTWAKAANSLATVDSIASAGDEIWIADTHSENGATFNFTGGTAADPVKIISVETAGDTYSPGATFTGSSGQTWSGDISVFGLTLTMTGSADLTHGGSAKDVQQWNQCTITTIDQHRVGQANGVSIRFRKCSFVRNGASAEGIELLGASDDGVAEFWDCDWTKGSGVDQLFESMSDNGGLGGDVSLYGCDVSDFTNILNNNPANSGRLTLIGCEVHASYDLVNSTITDPRVRVALVGCSNGTITVPELGLTEIETFWGTVKSTLAKYRSTGADDGEQANAHAWEMVSSANAMELGGALESPPITIWDDGGSAKTFKVFVASGTTFQDDEVAIRLTGPAEATSTAQVHVEQSNDPSAGIPMDPRESASNLTTDAASTWNGTGVGTKQEMSITYTPGIAGPVTIRVLLMKASATLYVDPKVEVT